MIVMKFGGSSLVDKQRIDNVISIVKEAAKNNPLVVVSAHGKMTNCLIESTQTALDGVVDLREFKAFHFNLMDDLGIDQSLIGELLSELVILIKGVSLLRELNPKIMDRILSFGERISSTIVAEAMRKAGVTARQVNAFDLGFLTDSNYGSAKPLKGIESGIRKAIEDLDCIPVITGFIGKNENGDITTIGRNGSDYTASIIGASVEAEEVQIWTDVDGVMTADPSLDSRAQNLPVLSFREASELSYYGAKVLHAGTLVPAIRKNIPIRVVNTYKPNETGTVIISTPEMTNRIAKSIAYKEDVCLINISSPEMISVSQLLSAVLQILTQHKIDVHIAATSVSSVSVVTDKSYDEDELNAVEQALSSIGKVTMEKNKTIVCVVGEELRRKAGVLGKIFSEVGGSGIKARMVAQSASEINVAFLVDNSEIRETITALHDVLLDCEDIN